jgi:hypothetical protein
LCEIALTSDADFRRASVRCGYFPMNHPLRIARPESVATRMPANSQSMASGDL